jgi:preprotein translocase SecE subunit
MAKARIAPSNQRPQRPALPAGSGGSGRSGPLGYLRGVWEELKKVVWPARDELLRMTGIVIVTVIIFAALVGGTDYILSLGVQRAVAAQAAAATPTAAATVAPSTTLPAATAAPTVAPTTAPTVAP